MKRAAIFFLLFVTFSPNATPQGAPSSQATTPEGELRLGNQYFAKQDYPNAMTWYRKAADQGNAEAQANVAWFYQKGRVVEQDYAEAIAWYRKAASQGNARAQQNIGWFYENGLGVGRDYAEAMAWYHKAAEQGNIAAQTNVGWLYQNGWGVKQNYSEALTWYLKAADKGEAAAQNNIGTLYEKGQGVDQNYPLATAWYYRAADQGDVLAETNVGRLYRDGIGVQQDYGKAATWFRKAAEQGHSDAQVSIGWLYQNGFGVHQDYAEAMNWYRKAADQNDGNAQNNIGWLYQNGFGASQDYAEAMNWYRKAADQNNGNAQNNIGWLYQNGFGVKQDYAEATSWYRKAAAQGNARAKANLDMLSKSGLSNDAALRTTPNDTAVLLPNGVRAARPVFAPDPEYSEEARKKKITGEVLLSLIIGADGQPQDIKIVAPLGDGLDEKAVETIKTWKFEPATKDGKPVALTAMIEVQFHLYGTLSVGKVEVLGDSQSEGVTAYLSPLILEAEKCWNRVADDKTRLAPLKQVQLTVQISVEQNGRVGATEIVSSSGDEMLDRDARDCVSPLKAEKPLPAEFTGKDLVIRMQLLHNTSGASINPLHPQVTTGSKEQFYVDIAGTLSKGANWSLTGAGCNGESCGTISPDGLYTAPEVLPQPAFVRVKGTLAGANPIPVNAVISLTRKNQAVSVKTP